MEMGSVDTDRWRRALLPSVLLVVAVVTNAQAQSPSNPWDLPGSGGDPFAAFFPNRDPQAPTLLSRDFNNEWAAGTLTFGEQALNNDTILSQDYEGHGTSFTFGRRDGQVSFQGFAFYPEVTRQDGGDKPQDADQIQGFSFSVAPVRTVDHALSLTNSYYRGTRRSYDEGADAYSHDRGDGWSLGAESSWFEDVLKVRFEVASAFFDAASSSKSTRSEAYQWGLSYQPWQESDLAGDPISVALDLDYQWIGAGFRSLIADQLDGDNEALGASMALSWGDFSAEVALRHKTDNVEDHADQATNRSLNVDVFGRYQINEEADWLTESAWLGRPYLEIGFDLDRHKRKTALTATDNDDRNDDERAYRLALGSDYERGSWSLAQVLSYHDDKTLEDGDRFQSQTSLATTWQPHSGLSLDSSLGWSLVDEVVARSDSFDLDLDITLNLIPESLDLTLGAEFDLSVEGAGVEASEGLKSELKWHALTATATQPGLTWAFQGSMDTGHGYDDSDDNGLEWALFGELQLTAPFP